MVIGEKGLNETNLRNLSSASGEPSWALDLRLQALRDFERRPLPSWGADLSAVDFDEISYGRQSNERSIDRRVDTDASASVSASGPSAGDVAGEESAEVFHRYDEELRRRGVIFCEMDVALRDHPELVEPYFATIVPVDDNKFAALNTSVWSGGSFIYVPPGVEVEMPLQAYFRSTTERMGSFERNLIVADEGSKVHYIEGCSAPVYSREALHAGVVEVVVKTGAEVCFTAIQNWSGNVFNLVTKRARVEAEGRMEWIDSNIGGRLTMTNPTTELVGQKAAGLVRSVSYAGRGQHQDIGAKMIHAAPETTSDVISKAIAGDGGLVGYRTLVQVQPGADRCVATARHDALVLDQRSASKTDRSTDVVPDDAAVGYDESTSGVSDDERFYLMSRGLSAQRATAMVVNGFADPVTRRLPMEYAVEWSRLIELQMEGSIG